MSERDAELLERYGCESGTPSAFCKRLEHRGWHRYEWQTMMNLCAPQPPNDVAIWDDLQMTCERLAYSIVDLQSGRVDYELDLNP